MTSRSAASSQDTHAEPTQGATNADRVVGSHRRGRGQAAPADQALPGHSRAVGGYAIPLMISSVIFLASPNSIIVRGM